MKHVFPNDQNSDTFKFQQDLSDLIDEYPELTVAQIVGVMEIVKWIWINRIPDGNKDDKVDLN